ncbi:MAG: helix-turn-helix transcriptional regulator [Oscillospiraceae bacterium]|nr:helix-turn-helix transcriptional regulator [Oscillospiraceae bacterium]
MILEPSTNDFEIEYIESEIAHSVLWERHCHSKYEMIAVADGDITIMLEGQNYRLTKNEIIMIPPLFYHSVTVNGEGCYRRITALFSIDAIPCVLQSKFANQERTTTVSTSRMEKIKEICRKEDASFFAPLLQAIMIEIFYDTFLTPQPPKRIEADEFLQRTFEYIDLHLHERILLDDLARHTSRSKSSFCHLFESKMNISPKQYILQKKLALAGKLIGDGIPATVAAAHVGYENYSNFYRVYLKHFGTSPTKKE